VVSPIVYRALFVQSGLPASWVADLVARCLR
jgi:hypothetical protein